MPPLAKAPLGDGTLVAIDAGTAAKADAGRSNLRSNVRLDCPTFCRDDQDTCYIPSYDAKGDWISTQARGVGKRKRPPTPDMRLRLKTYIPSPVISSRPGTSRAFQGVLCCWEETRLFGRQEVRPLCQGISVPVRTSTGD